MTQRLRRLVGRLPGGLCMLYGVMLSAILALLLFWQKDLLRYFTGISDASNLLLLLAAVPLAAGSVWALAPRRRAAESGSSLNTQTTERRFLLALIAADIVLLVLQLVVTRSVWFYTGWDAEACYDSALMMVDTGKTSGYLQLFPNNAPYSMLLTIPLWIARMLKLVVPYATIPYLGALSLNLSCFMTALCAHRITHNRAVTVGVFVISALWIGLSAFLAVPYTDVFSILFPLLALYCYLTVKRSFVRWLLISFICFFGYSIKPAVLILFIALVILGGLRVLSRKPETGALKRLALIALAILLGFAPAKLWKDGATKLMAGSVAPEGQLSETHFLMMGMNPDSMGGHSPDDVAYSRSFATLAERRSANIQRALERFNAMDAREKLRFFSIKAYKAYADGTFAASESFIMLEKVARRDALSVFFRNILYNKGAYRYAVATGCQVVWLAILLLCAAGALFVRGRQPILPLLALSLLGLTLYLLLLEVWPRYLFIYAPFFLLAAALSAEGLGQRLREVKRGTK